MKIIYANIIWYVITILGLLGAAFNRHSSSDWENMSDVTTNYDIVFGCLALYLIICGGGLLLKRRWGFAHAVSVNATLTLIPLGIFIASLAIALPTLDLISIFKANFINLLYGTVSLIFWISIIKVKRKLFQ